MTRRAPLWVRVERDWEGYPLEVRYLRPGSALTAGERGDVIAAGPERRLVIIEPERAWLVLDEADELIALASARGSSPYRNSPRRSAIELEEMDSAVVRVGGIAVALRVERAAPSVARRVVDARFGAAFGLTLAAVAALLVRLAMASPPLGEVPEGGIDREQLRTLRAYLASAAERECVVRETEQGLDFDELQAQGCYLPRRPRLRARDVAGCSRHPRVEPERFETFPHVALRSSGEPVPPPRDWGEFLDPCIDSEDGVPGIGEAPEGAMWSSLAALSATAVHEQQRTGSPAGRVRVGSPAVVGPLPAEIIQRVVRRHEAEFRRCYERGLIRNPHLTGRATTRLVLDRDGVASAANGGSDLPDSRVVRCVVERFAALPFPTPPTGTVRVVAPLWFEPEPESARAAEERRRRAWAVLALVQHQLAERRATERDPPHGWSGQSRRD